MGRTLQKNRVEQNGLVKRILLVLTLCLVTLIAGFQANAQASLPASAASIPFSYGGVWVSPVALPAYLKTYGISQIGTSSSNPQNLGTSTAGGIAVFDNSSANPEEIIIRFTSPAFNLSYFLTYQNGTEIGSFEVFESQQGTTWQRVRKFGEQTGDTPVPFDPSGTKFQDRLAPTTTFVKFRYTTKTGGTFIYLDDIRVTGGPDMDITAANSPLPTGSTYTFAAPASPVTFGIKNLGVDELKLTSNPNVVISGPDAGAFTVTQPATASLPANSNTSFTVTFSPTSSGLKAAVLTIANNDPDESAYIINLAGDGGSPAPQITSFKDGNENDITEAKIGDRIFIDGADFSSSQLEVSFAGSTNPIPVAATFISTQRIQVTVPSGAITGGVTVKTAGGSVSRSLSIMPLPVVSGLFDAAENGTAKTAGKVGDQVYIYGAEFIGQGLTVTFAGATGPVNATAELISATVIRTMVPENAVTGPVQVTTAGGSATSEPFTVIPQPEITAFKDINENAIVGGKRGTNIFIEGAHFTQQDLHVTFTTATGMLSAGASFISAQRIQVTIPNEAITGVVTVTAAGGEAARSFLIFLPPVVSGLFDAAENGTAKTAGKVGDQVYIYGAEFIGQGLTVTFAGATGPVNTTAELISATVIRTMVPENAVTGPVQVTTAGGSATSEPFTVYLKPTITAFTDYDLNEITGGKAGDEIYIQGTDFTQQNLNVTFSSNTGTIQAEATWINEQYILAKVPQGAVTGMITVSAAGGDVTRSFIIFPAPQVSGLFDAELDGKVKTAGKVGEEVYIHGRDFTQNALSVSFTSTNGLVGALAEFISVNVIRAIVPNEAQTGTIRVTAAGGSADSETFTVLHQPTISAFLNLNQYEITGGKAGDEILIEGTHFTQQPLNVTFAAAAGTIPAEATWISSQQIRATVPAEAITGEVTVTAGGGEAARSFLIFLPPAVSGLFDAAENGTAKTTGKVGEEVFIYGAEFIGQGLTVAFSGENGPVDATAELLGPTVIRTVVPAEAVTGPILVTTAGGSATSEPFTVIPLPAISGFSDLALNAINGSKPGQEIFIEGRNFSGTPPDVTFTTAAGPAATTASLVSAQRIRATVPAEAITGNVVITTPGGTATRLFTVFLSPVVSGLYDAAENGTAITAGKTADEVYIYGANFVPDNLMVEYTSAGSTVAAAAEFISANVIRTVVPAGAVTGPIQLTTAGGAVTTESFTVFPPPSIAAFTDFDLNEITGGKVGDEIYIRGTNFTEDQLAVTFTGAAQPIQVAAPQWFSEEYILVQVPEGAVTGEVAVTAAGGTATGSFTIFPVPQITGIYDAPADGNLKNSGKAGEVVYIRGNYFTLNSLSVAFPNDNGFVSALTEFINSTVIKAVVPQEAQTGPIRVTSAGGLALSETFNILGNTYTWNGTSNQWSAADSWTPARTTLLPTDELVFDGNETPTPTVLLDLGGAQTIGQLKFINGVAATVTVDANQVLTLNGGVTGTDFLLDATSSLTLTNSVAGAGLALNISSGETGVVAGAITLQGAASAPHQLTAHSANGLIFQSGSTFTTDTNFTGNPFGTITPGSVNFANGSVYRHQAGGSPFGGASAVVKFEPTSTYHHLQNTAPDLANRVYGNLVVDVAGFDQQVKGAGSLHVTNLTMANTGTFNVGLAGTININGDILVHAGGTLTFNPDASSNYNMVGTSQSVDGDGIFTLGPNANFNISESSTVTVSKIIGGTQPDVSGQVGIFGTVITDLVNGLWGASAAFQTPVIIRAIGAGSTVVYTGTGPQIISELPVGLAYANLTIAGDRGGATVTLPAGTALKIGGEFNPSATNVVYSPNSTIEFNGGGVQPIPVFPYHNLTVSGPGIKILAGDVTALGEVLINNSLLQTGANILDLGPAATFNEAGSGYLSGQVRVTREVTAGATQPFAGIGVSMTPAGGSAAPGSTTILRDTRTAVPSRSDTGGKGSITRVYHIHNTTPGIEVTMTLAYAERELEANGLDEGSGLRMYRQNAEGLWEEQIESQFNATANTVTLAGVTAFSPWTLAGPNEVLPVEVTAFTAKPRHDLVELSWTTAMEDNNQGFEVEVSTDALYYEKVGFVASQNPNSRFATTYTFTDAKTLATGTRYYRLKQVDLDGTASYYGPKAVKIESLLTAVSVYPNPFNDLFTVKYAAQASHPVTITVLDALGKKVSEQGVPVTPGMNYLQVQVGNQHPKGLYLLQVSGQGNTQTFRMIKK